MLRVHEHATVEDASLILLPYALDPLHWLVQRPDRPSLLHQARVGSLRIYAGVNVRASLEVVLHVSFRAPGLTPARAVEHLELFLGERIPLLPNTEWEVEVDARSWIHFQRAYLTQKLVA